MSDTTKKYLDDIGLNYLISNYIIKRQIGNEKGDMLYVSSPEIGTIGQEGYTPPLYQKVGGEKLNNSIPMLISLGDVVKVNWSQLTAEKVLYSLTEQNINNVDEMLSYLYYNTKTKIFINRSPQWVSDSTYSSSGYIYKGIINNLEGVNSNCYAEVVFDVVEAISGNYAPVCETAEECIYIYSKVNTSITIPTIKVEWVT